VSRTISEPVRTPAAKESIDDRTAVIKAALNKGKTPGKTITWKEFCKEVRLDAGITGRRRGYSDERKQRNIIRKPQVQKRTGLSPSQTWRLERCKRMTIIRTLPMRRQRRNDSHAGRNPQPEEALLTVHQVAENWRVSQRTVRRMIADGRLPIIRVGRAVRIPLKQPDLEKH
jgi:excisionase family DNA binding protein